MRTSIFRYRAIAYLAPLTSATLRFFCAIVLSGITQMSFREGGGQAGLPFSFGRYYSAGTDCSSDSFGILTRAIFVDA